MIYFILLWVTKTLHPCTPALRRTNNPLTFCPPPDSLGSVRGPPVLADGAVPRPRPEHHLRRIGLLSLQLEDGSSGTRRRCTSHVNVSSSCRDVFRSSLVFLPCGLSPTNALKASPPYPPSDITSTPACVRGLEPTSHQTLI